MKVRISTIILFVIIVSFYTASILSFLKADKIDKADIAQCNSLFSGTFAHGCSSNLNNWHYIGVLFLIAAIGFTIGAIKWRIQSSSDETQDDTS